MEMKKREIPSLFYVLFFIFVLAAAFDHCFPKEHDVKATKASLPGTYVESDIILTFKHDGSVIGIGKYDKLIDGFSFNIEYPHGFPDAVKNPRSCLEVFAKAVLNGRCEKSIGANIEPTYVMYGVYEMDEEHHTYSDDFGLFADTFPCVDITWRAIEDTPIPEYLGEPKMLRVHGYDQRKKYYLLNLGAVWLEKCYPIVPEYK